LLQSLAAALRLREITKRSDSQDVGSHRNFIAQSALRCTKLSKSDIIVGLEVDTIYTPLYQACTSFAYAPIRRKYRPTRTRFRLLEDEKCRVRDLTGSQLCVRVGTCYCRPRSTCGTQFDHCYLQTVHPCPQLPATQDSQGALRLHYQVPSEARCISPAVAFRY